MEDSRRERPATDETPTEIRVPKLPESVSDATVVAWHKHPGDAVRRDENLVDIETDKVVFEVPSPIDGVLESIAQQDGETVVSDQVLATIIPGAGAQPPAPDTPPPALSPAVRRLVDEHHLDPRQIPASGKNGRPTKADVLAYLESRDAPTATQPQTAHNAPEPQPAAAPPSDTKPTPDEASAEEPGVRRVPMSRLRRRIAERLVEAQHSAAILTTFNEVNMAAVLDLRHQYRERFEKQHGIKLGLMSFFIKASVAALQRFPIVNATLEDDDILYHDYYDISLAVSTDRGLVVPVLRDADNLGFAAIERAIADFAQRARAGDLSIEELTGGTFTITNGGVFGSLLSTPILNPPQSAILGMHKIEDRPVVEGGEIRARPMMYVALSYDHRLIDGREAVQFLTVVKELLEDPARLLLQV